MLQDNITIANDLSVGNEIKNVSPMGVVRNDVVKLEVVTNKASTCYYGNKSDRHKFSQEDAKVHFALRSDLGPGAYVFPVECIFQDATSATSEIEFVIDKDNPVIKKFQIDTKPCNNTFYFSSRKLIQEFFTFISSFLVKH